MKKLVILLGKLMSQRSALIASLAAKGALSETELRRLSDMHNSIAAVREVLASKREKSAPSTPAAQPPANNQQNAKRMIAR